MFQLLTILIQINLLLAKSSSYLCTTQQFQNFYIRGKYLNILSQTEKGLITTKTQNYFYGGKFNSIPFRKQPYLIGISYGFVQCDMGKYITINLLQRYYLNCLKVRLWDLDNRSYNFIIFAIYQLKKTKIFDSLQAKSTISIKFKEQYVDSISFFNRGGSTANNDLHLLKIVTSYQI